MKKKKKEKAKGKRHKKRVYACNDCLLMCVCARRGHDSSFPLLQLDECKICSTGLIYLFALLPVLSIRYSTVPSSGSLSLSLSCSFFFSTPGAASEYRKTSSCFPSFITSWLPLPTHSKDATIIVSPVFPFLPLHDIYFSWREKSSSISFTL